RLPGKPATGNAEHRRYRPTEAAIFMKPAIVRRLLRLYPGKWRNEYGAELEELLFAVPLGPSVICNVVWNALGQQIRDLHPTVRRITLAIGSLYAVSLVVSIPLWRLISIRMTDALAQSGRLPRLAQARPFEGFVILFLLLAPLVT